LIDTGADSTVLAPGDVLALHLGARRFQQGPPSVGVGGTMRTAQVEATLTLGTLSYDISLRLLVPRRDQQGAVSRIPSLLGRDILAHFALIMEERTGRVLLLEPREADALPWP
jgi:hypothetical protein